MRCDKQQYEMVFIPRRKKLTVLLTRKKFIVKCYRNKTTFFDSP